jgi:Type II secretory pathway, component HofQ
MRLWRFDNHLIIRPLFRELHKLAFLRGRSHDSGPILCCHSVAKYYGFNRRVDFYNAMLAMQIQLTEFINKRLLHGPPQVRAWRMRRLIYIILYTALAMVLLVWPPVAGAQVKPTLDAMDYSLLPGNRVRIELRLSAPAGQPQRFSIHDPARIVLDFPGVSLNLAQKTRLINIGLAHSVSAVASGDRTRVVIRLFRHAPYTMDTTDGTIYITIGASGNTGGHGYPGAPGPGHIEDVVFEKSGAGEARIQVRLSDPLTVINTQEQGNRIMVDFLNTELPQHLHRILDVTDFATPVLTIDMSARGDHTRMVINTTGQHEHLIYQTNSGLVIGERSLRTND